MKTAVLKESKTALKTSVARSSSKLRIAWLLILPVLIIRGFTTIYPSVVTFVNSFFEINMFTGGERKFVGLANFGAVFTDEKIITSLKFTLIFTVASMIFHIIFGFSLALLLNLNYSSFRTKSMSRRE